MRQKAGVGRAAVITVALVLIAVFVYMQLPGDDASDRNGAPEAPETFDAGPTETVKLPSKAYLKDACKLPAEWVRRIYRGWAPGSLRDLDLVIVPKPPNYMGTFINTSHSAPYGFLQNVPLVLYGPGFIEATGDVQVEREVTIADLAPTFAELMGFEFPERAGTSLSEVLLETEERPKLIFTAVIDGGGWNALKYWPDAWPELQELIDDGVNIDDATVGSSPSITPATHTNLSTGTFPRFHGVTAIAVRDDDGSIVGSFSPTAGNPGPAVMDPTITLEKTTVADLWDKEMDNQPLIGMLAAGNLQLGMIGHGAALPGGDNDIAAILSKGVWATNPEFYSLPEYVNTEVPGPEEDLAAADRADGAADGLWHGHELDPLDATPAFAPWENRVMQALLEREGFGDDEITDLFYVNYKAPDKAGHQWNMTGPEQEDTIESVDRALGDMRRWLDENVGENNYVMVVTADHGQTPLDAGGWPIGRPEILADIRVQFDRIDNGIGIIEQTSASSFFSRKSEMDANGVTPEQVATFLSRYTIGDNIADGADIPEGFEDRLDERIFDAVFPGSRLPQILECTGA
ncbi:MAG TPA: alkaline phosphatase family protein [Actinomycetota bacterium]|nr:alkaline phosphatase family protein [Actinomycetota bacterium]